MIYVLILFCFFFFATSCHLSTPICHKSSDIIITWPNNVIRFNTPDKINRRHKAKYVRWDSQWIYWQGLISDTPLKMFLVTNFVLQTSVNWHIFFRIICLGSQWFFSIFAMHFHLFFMVLKCSLEIETSKLWNKNKYVSLFWMLWPAGKKSTFFARTDIFMARIDALSNI